MKSSQAVLVTWMCTAAAFGFLAFLSNPPYIVMSGLSAVFAWIGHRQLRSGASRKLFSILLVCVICAGLLLGQLFFQDGALTSNGVAIVFVATIPMIAALTRIYSVEAKVAADV